MQTGHNERLVQMKREWMSLQALLRKRRYMGVRGRLLVSFLAVSAFGVLAALAGMGAFHLVGNRLQEVASRNTSALAVLELSRSTERVLGAIPGLLGVSEQEQRQKVSRHLTAATDSLRGEMLRLVARGHYVDQLQAIDLSLEKLSSAIVEMDSLVRDRLIASEVVASLQIEAHLASRQIRRLLSPWIDIVDMQVPDLIAASTDASPVQAQRMYGQLNSLVGLQRHTQIYGRHVSTLFDFLSESSRTTDEVRLRILTFQLERELVSLKELDKVFDSKLRQSLRSSITILESLSLGTESLPAARMHELNISAAGEALLHEMVETFGTLTISVDQMVSSAKQGLILTIDEVLHLQEMSSHVLILLIFFSLLTSLVIFKRYVGGNILRRLNDLSSTMAEITQGSLSQPVCISGDDEISEMSLAVEQFRQNTQERDELLIRQSRIAVQLEEEVQIRTTELRVANEFKTRFLASASHDIRQPLHALNLFVGQLKTAGSTANHRLLLERIDTSVTCMNDLFEGLLDMSKLDAGVLKPECSSFPVSDLLTLLETTFSVTSSARGLRFDVVKSNVWLRSDATLLKRVLLNLVSNAFQCTTRGGVVVGCRRGKHLLRIDVIDTGPGIPEDKLEAVFEEHYQLEHCNSGTSGLGLGLTIVKRLTDLLGCPLQVRSTLGKGSCFSITVPVVPGNRNPTSIPSHQPGPDFLMTGTCVVVVDDDASALAGMKEMLLRWGCTVVACADINHALEKLSSGCLIPHIIICDVHLSNTHSGVSGIASIRKVHGPRVPACLITGDTSEQLQQDAYDRGLYLMHKPLAAITLRTVMNRLLEKPTVDSTCERIERVDPTE